jgi:hypothetical protein
MPHEKKNFERDKLVQENILMRKMHYKKYDFFATTFFVTGHWQNYLL